MSNSIINILSTNPGIFHQVVDVDKSGDVVVVVDLTSSNNSLNSDVFGDIVKFESFINEFIRMQGAKFAVGGYLEFRDLYSRSDVFSGSSSDEERRLHLGVDIWGPAGTPIYAPMDGIVHSFAMNDAKGDYGATIILMHDIHGVCFHTLYGHLSASDLNLETGQKIKKGSMLAHFGNHHENGYWPPHLHFQIITDMEGKKGDYPGVCSLKNQEHFKENCPDPNLILQLIN
jgi:murein DD-endopeptidase MepM/ murein hydrolase activator NlpD